MAAARGVGGSLLGAGQGVLPGPSPCWVTERPGPKYHGFLVLRPLGSGGALLFPAGHREPTGLPSGSGSCRERKIILCCLQHVELSKALGKPWLVVRQFARVAVAAL